MLMRQYKPCAHFGVKPLFQNNCKMITKTKMLYGNNAQARLRPKPSTLRFFFHISDFNQTSSKATAEKTLGTFDERWPLALNLWKCQPAA